MGRSSGSGRLWLAAGLSPLLHLAGAAAVVSAVSGSPAPDPAPKVPPSSEQTTPPPPERQQVALGIERSKSATITWIGFETPTEHAAPKGDIEQPALTRDAPSPPPQPPQPHTREVTESIQDPTEAAAPSPIEEPRERPAEPTEAAEPIPEPVVEPTAEPLPMPAKAAEGILPAIEAMLARLVFAPPNPAQPPRDQEHPDDADNRPRPSPAQSPPPTPPSEATKPATGASPPAPPEPAAEESPKEVMPFSVSKPVVVRPGRPAAAEGLEIETRHLRLSLYTQAVTGTMRAKVVATFNRQGRVTNVEFVRRTGTTDVDEPILNCVYSWRAKGKAIDALDAKDPEAGVLVPFEIIIR